MPSSEFESLPFAGTHDGEKMHPLEHSVVLWDVRLGVIRCLNDQWDGSYGELILAHKTTVYSEKKA